MAQRGKSIAKTRSLPQLEQCAFSDLDTVYTQLSFEDGHQIKTQIKENVAQHKKVHKHISCPIPFQAHQILYEIIIAKSDAKETWPMIFFICFSFKNRFKPIKKKGEVRPGKPGEKDKSSLSVGHNNRSGPVPKLREAKLNLKKKQGLP